MKRDTVWAFIASLIIATTLSLVVRPRESADLERELLVKLELKSLSEDLVAIQPPESVAIIAAGPRRDLDALQMAEITAAIVFTGAEAGKIERPVTVSTPVGSPVQFRVKRPRLMIELETLESKSLPVMVEEIGLPPAGLIYDGSSVFPDNVSVSGPSSYLPKVDRVRVLFDIAKIEANSSHAVDVEILDADGLPVPLVASNPPTVTLRPAVMAAPQEKRLLVQPDVAGLPAVGYELVSVQAKPNQIVVTGDSRTIGGLAPTILTAPIDLTDKRMTATITTSVVVPPGVTVQGESTVEVTYVIARSSRRPEDNRL
jgi:YbbR domain-containing protein